MSETLINAVVIVTCVGVAGYLVGSLFRDIKTETGFRKKWDNFGLSIAFAVLFFLSWIAHAVVQWGVYREQQLDHGDPATLGGYVMEFGQATLENWQSEFLQLFSFVVLSALLIHKGSAESKDSDEEIQRTLKRIEKRLDEMAK